MTVALMSGGRSFFGWGVDRLMSADIFDALNVNTRATGNWRKGKAPNFPTWPRPSDKQVTPKGEKPNVTVASLYQRFKP